MWENWCFDKDLIRGLILLGKAGKGLVFELFKCFCKRCFFLTLAPRSALEKFAAFMNPENKPAKENCALSWPSALEICGETVL